MNPGQRYQLAKQALTDAEKAWKDASFNYHQTAAATEAAYMNGRGLDDDVQARFHAADAAYSEALTRVVAAREFVIELRRQAVPSFEAMLAHPWTQVDPKSEILASIEEYRNAKPATAGMPPGAA